ncbi:FAD-dependent oxidoreductase [Cellvibrio japonicus]|uniref:Protein CbrA n=1 Tax=Cellvibrio japonicus (strain Ueda107) TaxID=498211 RepID=B3PIM4_CELJU|nr:NAD(P)/FAD-dependent oxidoreductase [Cellvibrio japonicus]ACE84257.1 conserved hypothetical protein [Cellvibrio japonicus Ueda107]QEI13945.1 FAD-dependent monooxygenase [Cellvibrio japonicus]QEI17519.1 FAD-dependent monooxygenase [Cellvibrio japonicus]QEI21095.1 FAD-dependent monooxygenase [Cellvibrio japonicus]
MMETQLTTGFDAQVDVLVIGSGPAGCTTALRYAQEGLRVALVERKRAMDSFKPVCTHFIQGCATPVLQKMGVLDTLKAAGAVRNDIHIWTRYGWIKPEVDADAQHHGYVIRRSTLDPILRDAAQNHPNIELYMGWRLVKLIENEQQDIIGAEIDSAEQKRTLRLAAQLTVGADGRNSAVAEGLPIRIHSTENKRTFFVSYYENLQLTSGAISQLWFWKKDIAYCFPSDGGVTLMCLGIHEDNMAQFKDNPEQAFHDYFKQLTDGPAMDMAQRVAPVTKGKHMHTQRRYHDRSGVALVGDALLGIDPFAGTGIGWAIQGGDWLVEETLPALKAQSPTHLRQALARYTQLHETRLRGHTWMISNYSSGRDFNYVFPPERLLFAAAVDSPEIARVLDLFLNRVISLRQLITPKFLLHVLWVRLRLLLLGRQPWLNTSAERG